MICFFRSSGPTEFEKYLKDQLDRQKQRSKDNSGKETKSKENSNKTNSNYGNFKKKPKRLKEFLGSQSKPDLKNSESTAKVVKKDLLKKKILHPKKKIRSNVGGKVSTDETDKYKSPGRPLSETIPMPECTDDEQVSETGSEYVPSDLENSEDDYEPKSGLTDNSNEKDFVGQKKKKGKKNANEVVAIKKRHKDDGNLENYLKRIKTWKKERLKEKHEKILQGEELDSDEEEENCYEQFDGGFKIPLSIWKKLFKYQRTCVRWLWELHSQSCGGILGDEMGLGKTIQMISFLVGLSYSGLRSGNGQWQGLGPVLIVAPATVLHQWVKEFHRWWPPFRVAVLHDSGTFTGTPLSLIYNINKNCGILIVSYTGIRSHLSTLLKFNWHYIILDEGHKIRNPEAQITTAVKRFSTPHRIILSG